MNIKKIKGRAKPSKISSRDKFFKELEEKITKQLIKNFEPQVKSWLTQLSGGMNYFGKASNTNNLYEGFGYSKSQLTQELINLLSTGADKL